MERGEIEEGCVHPINHSQFKKSVQVNATSILQVLIHMCVEGERNTKVQTIASSLRR